MRPRRLSKSIVRCVLQPRLSLVSFTSHSHPHCHLCVSDFRLPGDDEFEYVSRLVGGTVVLQKEDFQLKYGQGPVALHILACQATDGAGHASDHFDVIQSWQPIFGQPVEGIATASAVQAAASIKTMEVAHVSQSQEEREADDDLAGEVTEADAAVLLKRLSIPGASTAAEDTAAFYAELDSRVGELDAEQPDAPASDQTIPDMVKAKMDWLMEQKPQWAGEVQHLALALLFIYRCRFSDLSLPEYVALTHVALGHGDSRLVAHDNMPFFWSSRFRAWERFEGLVPQNVLIFLKDYFLKVEGILRAFTGDVQRTDDGIIAAVEEAFQRHADTQTALSRFVDNAVFSVGAEPKASRKDGKGRGRGLSRGRSMNAASQESDGEDLPGHDEGPSPKEPWYIFIAKTASLVSKSLESSLRGRTLIPYYCEWCSVPRPAGSGVAYLDCGFFYDQGDAVITRSSLEDRKKLYLAVPHNILAAVRDDPVLKEADHRVRKFYAHTFWANSGAHRVCMAALALAKRFLNVDQVFFFLGPGGVGLSLMTAHLDAMIGSFNHKYFDPQVPLGCL